MHRCIVRISVTGVPGVEPSIGIRCRDLVLGKSYIIGSGPFRNWFCSDDGGNKINEVGFKYNNI